ncbi:hypothetical protein ONE63_004229 [Megalurothrips usitatus]|uniref:Uncharacterized protein n=1 Tax=Megalurothrips usitatus TaxID=439358 RepID=A0AAV7X6H9_9NEOP|nr:hypothetical protein ONE63_004229 [Megalurothrips usitatus]
MRLDSELQAKNLIMTLINPGRSVSACASVPLGPNTHSLLNFWASSSLLKPFCTVCWAFVSWNALPDLRRTLGLFAWFQYTRPHQLP